MLSKDGRGRAKELCQNHEGNALRPSRTLLSHKVRLAVENKVSGERLDNDPSGSRYGCFLPDLTGLARCLPAPTSHLLKYSSSCRFARAMVKWRTKANKTRICHATVLYAQPIKVAFIPQHARAGFKNGGCA